LPSLLFEIGCEELPASACREAEAQLPALAEQLLGVAPTRVFVGPRRLAIFVEELPERTADEWVKGPPVALRERAAEGFARRYEVSEDELEEREGFLGVTIPGQPVEEVLPERLADLVRGLQFGKSMRWGPDFRFSRPVRWLCAKLDDDDVPVLLIGVRTAGFSYGHRFASGAVEIPSATAYLEVLRGADVEPDQHERRRLIVEDLDALGEWSDPLGKLEEVVHLVESPIVLASQFDERFLRLPERVIVTAMQSHQRYFPLGGTRFAVVANGGDAEIVRGGNTRVLEGRLDDAAFTFDRDVAVGIDALAERLGSITFLAGAGSFADKAARLVELARSLGGDDHALAAARLAKADQAAELVREFADLEGHIGANYAELAGYPEEVCRAIDEHYLPDAADAPLPSSDAGRVVAAADKLDLLVTVFGLGKRPTGSRDPYGLRRAAIGLCRLALEGGVRIERSLLPDDVREFVEERLEGLLDVPVEFTRAARASAAPDLGGLARLARLLHNAEQTPEFAAVYTAYERAHRLAGRAEEEAAPAVDPALFEDPAERELADALAGASIEPNGDLSAAAALAPHVDRFFDAVLVMAEDPKVRANRLRLLLEVRNELGKLGDFSQIPR
jgi:glycyl-tRNA synthetase beta chain